MRRLVVRQSATLLRRQLAKGIAMPTKGGQRERRLSELGGRTGSMPTSRASSESHHAPTSSRHPRRSSVSELLEEAVSTPLASSPRSLASSRFDEHHEAVLPPPRAYIASHGTDSPSRQRPHLISQVSRASIPVSGLVHVNPTASSLGIGISSHSSMQIRNSHDDSVGQTGSTTKGKGRERVVQGLEAEFLDIDQVGRRAGQSHTNSPRGSLDYFRIPELSIPKLPFTTPAATFSNPFGKKSVSPDRPRSRRRSSSTGMVPPKQLQRTITSVLSSPPNRSASYQYLTSLQDLSTSVSPPSTFPLGLKTLTRPTFSLPKAQFPSLPTLSAPFSTSSTDGLNWRGWWDGPKRDVMNVQDSAAKKKGRQMLKEEDKGATPAEEQAKLSRKYASPKNPIIFCHGLLGFDYLGPASLPPLQISHWRGIREVLESNGTEVMITRVPATSSVKDRAKILMEAIEERYTGREVNLVGHSMGGLDCRYLISVLKPTKFKVVSCTTISTPHKGSTFADYVIDNVIGRDRLPLWLALLDTLKFPNSGDGSAFESLGTDAMVLFNEEVPDDPNVKYFSWGATFDPGLLDTFRWPHSVILEKEGANDGLVSVESAKHGEYMGTLEGVNHLDLVGWVNHVRYTLSAWSGKEIAFKPATFYLEVADHLAKQGF